MPHVAPSDQPDLAPAADTRLLRRTFGLFPSGVAAVSAVDDHGPAVLIVASFQVGISLDPPLVLFAVRHGSRSWARLRTRPRLGVSILGEKHADTALQLASPTADRFLGVATSTAPAGAHFICGAPAWLECSLHLETPAGDHQVVLMRVESLATDSDLDPLVWHESTFRPLSPRPAPEAASPDDG